MFAVKSLVKASNLFKMIDERVQNLRHWVGVWEGVGTSLLKQVRTPHSPSHRQSP